MSQNSTDIESDNDIKWYSKRPKSLDNWCLSDYISQLEIKYPNKLNQDLPGSDEDNSDNDEVQHNDTGDEDTNEQTADDSRDRINITLNNGNTIKHRKSFRVIDMYDITRRQILNNISENYYCYFIIGGVKQV